MLPFGSVTTACVALPRTWAVSTGSHMQQIMVRSFRRRLHVQALLYPCRNLDQQIAYHSPCEMDVLGVCVR